jgi:hypothetical protein
MTFYRHNGGKVAELNHDVDFFPSEFAANSHVIRLLWHQKMRSAYPHALRFFTKQEKYFYRPERLRHLRVEQWYRYYTMLNKREGAKKKEEEGPDEARIERTRGGLRSHGVKFTMKPTTQTIPTTMKKHLRS